jgi:hypothetical protein
MKKNIVVYIVAGIIVFTLCFAPSAHAIVPALAYGLWLGFGVIAGSAAVYDASHDESDRVGVDEQRGSGLQQQDRQGGSQETDAGWQQIPG